MAQNQMMIVILFYIMACCCASSLFIGVLWGTNVLCDKTNPESQIVGMNCASVYESSGDLITGSLGTGGSPAPAPTLTPLQTLRQSGQAILVQETDISTSPPTFTAPTGIDTTKVEYTMSMDINIAQTGTRWRSIMNSGDPDYPPGTTSRRPGVFITGSDTDHGAPANRIHVVHGSTEDNNKNVITTFTATPGTYFNLTWVVSQGKLTTYINGQPDSTGTTSASFTWGTTNAWKWNSYLTHYPNRTQNTIGAVKIKNAYWFNKALTASEVATLSGGTTSTYMPQPLTMGTSGYTKEMYMPY